MSTNAPRKGTGIVAINRATGTPISVACVSADVRAAAIACSSLAPLALALV